MGGPGNLHVEMLRRGQNEKGTWVLVLARYSKRRKGWERGGVSPKKGLHKNSEKEWMLGVYCERKREKRGV